MHLKDGGLVGCLIRLISNRLAHKGGAQVCPGHPLARRRAKHIGYSHGAPGMISGGGFAQLVELGDHRDGFGAARQLVLITQHPQVESILGAGHVGHCGAYPQGEGHLVGGATGVMGGNGVGDGEDGDTTTYQRVRPKGCGVVVALHELCPAAHLHIVTGNGFGEAYPDACPGLGGVIATIDYRGIEHAGCPPVDRAIRAAHAQGKVRGGCRWCSCGIELRHPRWRRCYRVSRHGLAQHQGGGGAEG